MASRKPPGESQLGHSPFGKEKLEGSKRKHDDHGPDDSVPSKGNGRAIPGQHWERIYSLNEPSKNLYLTEGSDFNPKRSDERKTTHLKVNKEDH